VALGQTRTEPGARGGLFGTIMGEFRAARKQRIKSNPFGYLFIAPALILFLVFNVWPLIRGFLMSFTDYRFIYPDSLWAFNGLANYREMLQDKIFWDSLGVSVRYTLMVVPVNIVLSLLLATLITRVRHGAGFYRWIVYLPTILPIAVTLLMWGQFYGNKFGFINVTLRNTFLVKRPPNWLGSAAYALPAVAVADLWRSFGFPTLLFLIGLYNINAELYEAASIDGANGWMQFWKITIPLLRPTFLLIAVLSSGIAGAGEVMLVLTGGGPQNATRTIGLYSYNIAFQFGDLRMGYAAAIGLVLGLVGTLIAGFWFRTLRERGDIR